MGSRKGYHAPFGNPCLVCGLAASSHRVDHQFVGNGQACARIACGLPPEKHRDRARKRKRSGTPITYIGIDGEGQGRENHKYVLLAASTEDGTREWTIEAPYFDYANSRIYDGSGEGAVYTRQLRSTECLDLILSLPTKNTKVFSFAFNYDRTKMLTDLPDKLLYELERPDLPSRQPPADSKGNEHRGADPVIWVGPNGREYHLNLQGTKFTVAALVDGKFKKVVVWDLFKFFQGKFVTAIEAWKVGDEKMRAFIKLMKERRSEFDKEPPESVRKYCLTETRYIGELAHKLTDAHLTADLDLKSYHGAGSSGAAMLDAMGIRDKLAPTPKAMQIAVATAFGGGRFENSVIGTIPEALHNWDISSAYVYQLAFLPCLLHANWRHTTKREDIERAQAQNGALVRYTLGAATHCRNLAGKDQPLGSWGPFPFRIQGGNEDGCITYPIESGGGWVWHDEYVIGEKLFPHVEFREAWVYEKNCDCKPFEKIPEYYKLRLKVGKEGPGLVIKLGMNSCYGKLAQSIGQALFNSWIWAGMITSGCRAQLLMMLGMHDDFANMLMLATDGVLTREKLTPPVPLETRTGTPYLKGGKMVSTPLGGWEHKDAERGVFIARPGIYFPLNPTKEEIEHIRARGVGRSVILNSWPLLIDAWEREGVKAVARLPDVTRFCGAKTSISVSGKPGKETYRRAKGKGYAPSYGQWIERPVEMKFDPMPKRARVNPDGLTLALRSFPKDQTSAPYGNAMKRFAQDVIESASKDTAMMRAAEQEMLEQPDPDLEEYEFDMVE